jgi:pimeloyl-ACP methyl ester carboxylesterase
MTAVFSLIFAFIPVQDAELEGTWSGALKVRGFTLRLAFKVSKAEEGYAATMDSIDQGVKDIPVDTVTFKDGKVRFELKRFMALYEGTLEGDELKGTFTQAGQSLPLTLKRVEKVPELNRPQTPKPPFPYKTEEVTYENKKGGVTFAGTLTIPKGKGPFPVLLMITGSGAQDRDETIFGHKPFFVIADHLTRLGVATLRVDDRGVGGSTGDLSQSRIQDFADDVLAGIEFLKGRKDFDPKRIGLLGHSEGGYIAPMVAARSKDVAFLVLLAPPGISGEEILYVQGEALRKASGVDDKTAARERKVQEDIFAALKEETDDAKARERIRKVIEERISELPPEQAKTGRAALEPQINMVMTPWFRSFLVYDPRPDMKKVTCPVLALIGEKDLQVPPKENLPELRKAFSSADHLDTKILELKDLNHLFQKCRTGLMAEYAQIEETIHPSVLKQIGEWLEVVLGLF